MPLPLSLSLSPLPAPVPAVCCCCSCCCSPAHPGILAASERAGERSIPPRPLVHRWHSNQANTDSSGGVPSAPAPSCTLEIPLGSGPVPAFPLVCAALSERHFPPRPPFTPVLGPVPISHPTLSNSPRLHHSHWLLCRLDKDGPAVTLVWALFPFCGFLALLRFFSRCIPWQLSGRGGRGGS